MIYWKIKNRLFELATEVIDPMLRLSCGHGVVGDFDMIRDGRRGKFKIG